MQGDPPSRPPPGSNPDETVNMHAVGPPTSSQASVPPPTPHSSRASLSSLDAVVETPARLQMIVAVVLGVVLVAFPLYLWRRPRAEAIAAGRGGDDAGVPLVETPAPAPSEAEPKLAIGEPRIVSCQDPGPKKTLPADCDRLPELEKAFAKAIEDSASCVPANAGGGAIQYMADVSFKRKSVTVFSSREGRTIKSAKVAGACASAVKTKLRALPLDGVAHHHARYRLAITATYPAKP